MVLVTYPGTSMHVVQMDIYYVQWWIKDSRILGQWGHHIFEIYNNKYHIC